MIFVRRDGEAAGTRASYREADLVREREAGETTLRADTPAAATAEAPMVPLARLLDHDGAVRDAFARALPTPSLRRFRRFRLVLLGLALPPLLGLLELDRELTLAGRTTPSRLVIDVLFAAVLGWTLGRPTPRHPKIAAVVLFALAARWLLVAGAMCGHDAKPWVWGAVGLATIAGFGVLTASPDAERVTLELLGKLGIARSDVMRARRGPAPDVRLLGWGLVVGSLFPAMLHGMHRADLHVGAQAMLVLLYAAVLPAAARRIVRAPSPPAIAPATVLQAVAVGTVLTAALLQGSRHFFDAGVSIADCVGRLDEDTRRLVVREAAEVTRRLSAARASTALVLMNTVVMPFAEERIYRGLLARELVARYGRTYGLFASAVVFAVVHLGVYETALWQTLLLGVAFGVTFLEGGLLAAFMVHAMWNLLQLA